MPVTFPGTAVIPTRHRAASLERTLVSLAAQSCQPARLVLVDASDDESTAEVGRRAAAREGGFAGAVFELVYRRAVKRGAAAQRTQAMADAIGDYVLLMDDDVIFEPECVARMVAAIGSDPRIGAATALITNQCYEPPGAKWRLLYAWFAGKKLPSYAGRCFGPAVLQFAADDDSLPEVVNVDWMPSTCVLYRRAALPEPLFADFFEGYSYMEDAALALTVGRTWRLVNARTARVLHDSQPGDHKNDQRALAEMEMVNRHYVLWTAVGNRSGRALRQLVVFEVMRALALATSGRTRAKAWPSLVGKRRAWKRIRAWRRAQSS